jgi:hypothetical protein
MENSSSGTPPKSVHVKVDCPQVSELYEEIEKVKRQIDDLLATSDPNNPEVKANLKKMKQIKKFLTKKTAQGGGHSFLSLRRKRKQDIKNAINSILQDEPTHPDHDGLSVTSSEIIESIGAFSDKPKIVCIDVDDSFVHGVDCVISLWNEIKRHIH